MHGQRKGLIKNERPVKQVSSKGSNFTNQSKVITMISLVLLSIAILCFYIKADISIYIIIFELE